MPKRIQVIPIQDRYSLADVLDLPPVLSCDEAAEVAGIPVRSMRRLCESGDVAARKVGRRWLVNTAAWLERLGLYDETEAYRALASEREALEAAHERYDRAAAESELEGRLGFLQLVTGGE